MKSADIRIVFLQRGIVAVGRFSQEGSHGRLHGASIIRRWGTTHGIGEIAEGGPTDQTILDRVPTLEWHELTAIMTIRCNGEKWAPHVD